MFCVVIGFVLVGIGGAICFKTDSTFWAIVGLIVATYSLVFFAEPFDQPKRSDNELAKKNRKANHI